ncbi:unnamed protein product [Caenorhabditis sp. 36 PRJEB53466]|nr:unnamed protein product [Caenorhabditis sp. 36 PRJEB53466]
MTSLHCYCKDIFVNRHNHVLCNDIKESVRELVFYRMVCNDLKTAQGIEEFDRVFEKVKKENEEKERKAKEDEEKKEHDKMDENGGDKSPKQYKPQEIDEEGEYAEQQK